MNKSNISKNSSDSENKEGKSNLERSREEETEVQPSMNKNTSPNCDNLKNNSNNDLMNKLAIFNNGNFIHMNISTEDCIKLFDEQNVKMLNSDKSYKKLADKVSSNMNITPEEKQDSYTKKVIQIIKGLKISNNLIELPKLTYGKQLDDDEFIKLLQECVDFANCTYNTKEIEDIKNKLLKDYRPSLENMFKRGQIFKDVIENALLTILTEENKNSQEDNYNLLKIGHTTATPIIKMNFNNNKNYELNIEEFKEVFSSLVYVENLIKTLKQFIPKSKNIVITKKKLKENIKSHFDKYYIYFSDLPKNIYAITIHTGNTYIRSEYLYQYFNEKNKDYKLVIREKIILDIGHELAHALLREIYDDMGINFLIKSAHNDAKNKEIFFKDKFNNEIHTLNLNESGNVLDHNLFNTYYFDTIFFEEAELFLHIKKMTSITEFNKKLDNIINNEKNKGMIANQVNKFKKLNDEHFRRCIKSRILHTKKVSEEEYNNIAVSDESD